MVVKKKVITDVDDAKKLTDFITKNNEFTINTMTEVAQKQILKPQITMSSLPPGSSPAHNPNESNTYQSTAQDSVSQTQRHQAVPSSPLFVPPSSDIHTPLASQLRSRRVPQGSSPLPLPSSDFSSTANNEGIVRRRLHTRGDVHSSDILSSPMRRRYFTESSSQLNSEIGSGIPSSEPGRVPASTSSFLHSTTGTENPDEPVRVIWGTNVSIQECSDNFRAFLMSFKMKYRKRMDGIEVDPTKDEELYYSNLLNTMAASGSTNLNLDTKNLLAYPTTKKLYYQLVNYPQEVIPIMDQTIKDCLVSSILDNVNTATEPSRDSLIDQIESNVYRVRPFNIQNRKGMRELNPQDIDKLVTVKGLIIRSTPIIPDMRVAFFKCTACEHTVVVENDRGVIQEPIKCPRQVCAASNSMELIHNRSTFANKQVIKLQETPDIVPDGQTPHSISLCVYDELVDSTRAGDRVEICGIFKSAPVKVNPARRELKAF
ncbi:unnamed protein product [Ambrosiozyma monospora]|uniref:DNA replication licensing factor MCM4 n=1 Tax=Ambrosiozyma monospora TaxID=43982 RepID=A0A9W7DKK2_AMBMO|nr:unnamed protein product [Ambrosiozyma monospora]